MKKMHRQMKFQKKFCKDETGRKRRDNEEWVVDECKTCICKVCCHFLINSIEIIMIKVNMGMRCSVIFNLRKSLNKLVSK